MTEPHVGLRADYALFTPVGLQMMTPALSMVISSNNTACRGVEKVCAIAPHEIDGILATSAKFAPESQTPASNLRERDSDPIGERGC